MHYIENIPHDIDINQNYYIEFSIFGQKIRYKLELVANATIQANTNYGTIENLCKQNQENASQTTTKVGSIRGEDTDMSYNMYKQKASNKSSYKVDINKLKVFYLFTDGKKGIQKFISNTKSLKMNLFCDTDGGHQENERETQKFLGDVEFELTDFLNDKVKKREFYKYFNGKPHHIPILSWGVKFSLAIVPSYKEMDHEDDGPSLECDRLNIEKIK